ncbi:MAG: hypothetical protein JW803_03755 [Endomicrobiales bacterium]|nr:hypothetical protein [Endomicrobiales bacterium]
MKGFVCGVCGFISIDGSAPDKCPVCGAPKKMFAEKEDAMKTSKDVATYGESEKKHVPSIAVNKKCGLIPDGCVDVSIKVGEIIHPMLPEHYIMKVDAYIDGKYISRTYFTPEKMNPAVTLHLKAKSGKIAVVEHCNIHGSWYNEIDI